jgi:hypothetical protein
MSERFDKKIVHRHGSKEISSVLKIRYKLCTAKNFHSMSPEPSQEPPPNQPNATQPSEKVAIAKTMRMGSEMALKYS